MTTEQILPPKQVIYNGAVIDVVAQPGGVVLMISVPGAGELHSFSMSTEVAQEIGRKLSAPRVVLAADLNGNGKAHQP